MAFNKHSFFAIAFLISAVCSIGQRADNFPYSKYGIGDPVDLNNINSRGMGGLGAVYLDPYTFNFVNPASLPHVYSTSFDISVSAKYSAQSDPNAKNNFWSGNLDYMSLAFPLSNPINEAYEGVTKKHKFALALNLNRKSSVGYNIRSVDSLRDIGKINRNYVGQGGTNIFGLTGGYKYKEFSTGLTLGYVFGSTRFSRETNFTDVIFPFNNDFANQFFMRGFSTRLGFMYDRTLNKREIAGNKAILPKKLTIGLYVEPSTNVSTISNITEYAIQEIGTSIRIVDTISQKNNISGKGKLPLEFGLGIMYTHQEKFGFGMNYSFSRWSKYENEANYEKINSLSNTQSVSFGAMLRPDYKSFNNFLKRVQYRAGLYFTQDPRVIGQVQNSSRGLTFGMGMPFVYQRKISHVNLHLDAGQTGVGTLIKENYIKLSAGFNFNDDEWFLKRKYN
jgi:hypothetical protein